MNSERRFYDLDGRPRFQVRFKTPYMRIATVRSIYGPETYIQVPDWKWAEWVDE